MSYSNDILPCYVLNGGRNSSGHLSEIKSTRNCLDRVNLPDTPLVRHLTEANITYRQVNCFELCFLDFVRKYALEHELSEDEAKQKEEVNNYDR